VTDRGLFTENKDDEATCGHCFRKQYGDLAYRRFQEVIKRVSEKHSPEKIASMTTSFMSIQHIIGPMGVPLPMLDEEFDTYGTERSKFLLKEYKNALPLIEAALASAEIS